MSRRGTAFVLSSVHWHFTWQRHHEIAWRLAARGWRVVYVEPLPKRWPPPREWGRVWGRLAGRRARAGLCRQPESPGVEIVSPRLLPDTNAAARAANHRLAGGLARRLRRSAPARPRVVLNYLPIAASLALQRALAPDLAVYDCVWDWPHDPYSRPSTLRERELVAAADLVLADAPYLVERMRELHPRVHALPPAVDYERFAPARARRTRAPGEPPRCAYFGAVGANIDVGLLARLSASYPLRVIGPVQVPLPPLGPGAELLGPVGRERVPELLADADILVLPYREAAHSRGVVPAKTFECLATGKPTVAKGLPALAPFGDLFALAADDEDFSRRVAGAAAEPEERREQRLAAARANDWSVRIEELEGLLAAALAGRGAPA